MNANRYTYRVQAAGDASRAGYTLVELVVVMAIFMSIIIISSQVFNTIVSQSTQQTKSSQSEIQDVIGLEIMRIDLEHAGYGLPWQLNFVAEFDEGQAATGDLAAGIDPKQFNDKNNATADTNKVPRAVQAAASTTDGRDYLVIKSTLTATSDTTKKWAYVQGIGPASSLRTWGTDDLAANERVITIDSRTRTLIGTSTASADFSYTITAANMTPPDNVAPSTANFQPQRDVDMFLVYGVSSSTDLRVPYNRLDYYVKRPTGANAMPARCAPGTGLLYKAAMSHADGTFTQYPLVECVADMQVIFSLDTNGDDGVDVHVAEDGLSALTAKEIRAQLKEIRVYIVAHEGGKDTGYSYASPNIYVGEYGNGRTLDLNALAGPDYKYYRWKTYKLVIPKNMNF
jgi:hypothetical protein